MLRTLIITAALVVGLLGFDLVRPPVATAWSQEISPPVESGLTAPMLDTASAPEPAPAVVEAPAHVGDATPIMTTIKETLIAVMVALVTAAVGWMSTLAGKWFKGALDVNAVTANIQWESYARQAVEKATSYALKRVGTSLEGLQDLEVRGAVLQYALQFLVSQYPEVVKWIDTNNNGVIDWVETHLPAAPTGKSVDVAATNTTKVAKLFASPQPRAAVAPRKVVALVPKAAKRGSGPSQPDLIPAA